MLKIIMIIMMLNFITQKHFLHTCLAQTLHYLKSKMKIWTLHTSDQ